MQIECQQRGACSVLEVRGEGELGASDGDGVRTPALAALGSTTSTSEGARARGNVEAELAEHERAVLATETFEKKRGKPHTPDAMRVQAKDNNYGREEENRRT